MKYSEIYDIEKRVLWMLWVGREMNPLCYRPQSRCALYCMHCATRAFCRFYIPRIPCIVQSVTFCIFTFHFTLEAVPNPVPSLPSGRNKRTAFQTTLAFVSSTGTTSTYRGNLSLSGTKAWLSEFFSMIFMM